jgi:7,8-dihydroneopterin aldolase/epimerase/oxygenase
MVTIELQNIRLHAYHGVYPGELKTGSPYDVSIKVVYDEGTTHFDKLENTINYVAIFGIIRERMKVPTPLLEKVALGMIEAIEQRWPFIVEVMVSVYKLEPPIENFQGRVGVTIHKQFNV